MPQCGNLKKQWHVLAKAVDVISYMRLINAWQMIKIVELNENSFDLGRELEKLAWVGRIRDALDNDRFVTTDWHAGDAGALNLSSKGRTRTYAVWAQDAWTLVPGLIATVGGRYEWWRAFDGENFATGLPGGVTHQPTLSAHGFSPKASLAWQPDKLWTVRLSFGQA